jgi:hypothetical protein
MKATTIISIMALVSVMTGCGRAPLALAPSLPVQQAASVQKANADSNFPPPAGATLLYGAFIKAKVVSKQGTFNGVPVFNVATTPDSESQGKIQVTFLRSQMNQKTPQVGDTFEGFASYVWASQTNGRQILPGRVPYATSWR